MPSVCSIHRLVWVTNGLGQDDKANLLEARPKLADRPDGILLYHSHSNSVVRSLKSSRSRGRRTHIKGYI